MLDGLGSRAGPQAPPVRGRVPPPPVPDAGSVRLIPAGTSFPSRAEAPCLDTNAISSRRDILLLFLTNQDRPVPAGPVAPAPDRAWPSGLLARIAAGEAAIEIVGARAGERPHHGRRGARARARLHEATKGIDGECEVGAPGTRRARRRDDQHDLALHILAKAPGKLAQRGSSDLLVELRELAADGRRPVGRQRRQCRERLRQAAWRLERHDSLGGPEDPLELAAPPGRKPSKRHRSAGNPDATSAVITADGPGSTSTSRSRSRQARISR